MIVTTLFQIVLYIVKPIIWLTGMLPNMPSVVTGVGDLISDYVEIGVGFLFEVVGKSLVVGIFTMVLTYVSFKLVWRVTLFIWQLIRG